MKWERAIFEFEKIPFNICWRDAIRLRKSQLLIVFAGLSAIASYKPVFKVFEKIGSFYFIFVNRKSERFSMRILLKKKI